MNLKSKIISIFLLCMFYLLLSSEIFARPIQIVFSTPFAANHIMQVKVFEPWAEKIKKESKGKAYVEIYGEGHIGHSAEQYDVVVKGLADVAYALPDYTPGRFRLTEVFELPFMIKNAEKGSAAMWKILQTHPEFQKEYKDVKVLALFCQPAGHFFTPFKPIRKISDFKTLKLSSVNPFVSSALIIFGATPVSMTMMETPKALELGDIDGIVTTWSGLNTFNLDNIIRCATVANFYTITMMLVMNKDKYNSLPEDIKKIIDDNTGLSLSIECGKVFDQAESPYREQAIQKGVREFHLAPKEQKKLEAITLPLRIRWVKDMEDRDLPGKDILKAVTKEIGK